MNFSIEGKVSIKKDVLNHILNKKPVHFIKVTIESEVENLLISKEKD